MIPEINSSLENPPEKRSILQFFEVACQLFIHSTPSVCFTESLLKLYIFVMVPLQECKTRRLHGMEKATEGCRGYWKSRAERPSLLVERTVTIVDFSSFRKECASPKTTYLDDFNAQMNRKSESCPGSSKAEQLTDCCIPCLLTQ
ncbi:Hypothetical predicted protein [Podarcis lilfordi]|uniref:Uncharacterized protein n=1 Tax=Podarcis lilfordi TaxID=74358 RepID=A0AA35P9P8_9SAUR|nr:Hypothetical predicted protein [Podarcis lilfordi]